MVRTSLGYSGACAAPGSKKSAASACGSASSSTFPRGRTAKALKDEGVLCKETHDKVIRIAPPLIIRREEIDWAFERIRRVIEKG
jgi:acetylornithine/succinyldiaminopimelate/putrescine aminotransferase